MERPQVFVASPEQLGACVDDVAKSARLALDTESNGFHAYFEKVCLLQIATERADWALDTLALGLDPLVPLLADPERKAIRAYGVLGPGGIVRRSIFIVDPEGIVRYRQVALLGLGYQDVEDLKRSLERARAEALN